MAKIIKRFILNTKKTAFVVEHDMVMCTYLADSIVLFSGHPSIDCKAEQKTIKDGMNMFLSSINITVRKDPTNFRPRINKYDSVKDREQKNSGNYFIE